MSVLNKPVLEGGGSGNIAVEQTAPFQFVLFDGDHAFDLYKEAQRGLTLESDWVLVDRASQDEASLAASVLRIDAARLDAGVFALSSRYPARLGTPALSATALNAVAEILDPEASYRLPSVRSELMNWLLDTDYFRSIAKFEPIPDLRDKGWWASLQQRNEKERVEQRDELESFGVTPAQLDLAERLYLAEPGLGLSEIVEFAFSV